MQHQKGRQLHSPAAASLSGGLSNTAAYIARCVIAACRGPATS